MSKKQWARCRACGGEVVFDAWATLDNEVHSAFSNNICTQCDGKEVPYDKVDRDPASCGHKSTEDCMNCAECGECREDLDEDDVCADCGGIKI